MVEGSGISPEIATDISSLGESQGVIAQKKKMTEVQMLWACVTYPKKL